MTSDYSEPPNPCGCRARLIPREGDFTETHGLDCGPYETWSERWWECARCGSCFDDDELCAYHQAEEEESESLGRLFAEEEARA